MNRCLATFKRNQRLQTLDSMSPWRWKLFTFCDTFDENVKQVVEGHTKQLEKLQGLSEETKKRLENNETELAKVE